MTTKYHKMHIWILSSLIISTCLQSHVFSNDYLPSLILSKNRVISANEVGTCPRIATGLFISVGQVTSDWSRACVTDNVCWRNH